MLGARGAPAQEAATPFFNSFKAFCADTGAQAENVKAAVLAAGGTPHDPPTKSAETPFPMQTSLWDVKANGEALVVSAGHASSADGRTMIDCVISGAAADDASVAALERWAGVPASPGANARFAYYLFEDRDGGHSVLRNTSEAEGRSWRLTLIRAPGVASAELMHLLGR